MNFKKKIKNLTVGKLSGDRGTWWIPVRHITLSSVCQMTEQGWLLWRTVLCCTPEICCSVSAPVQNVLLLTGLEILALLLHISHWYSLYSAFPRRSGPWGGAEYTNCGLCLINDIYLNFKKHFYSKTSSLIFLAHLQRQPSETNFVFFTLLLPSES